MLFQTRLRPPSVGNKDNSLKWHRGHGGAYRVRNDLVVTVGHLIPFGFSPCINWAGNTLEYISSTFHRVGRSIDRFFLRTTMYTSKPYIAACFCYITAKASSPRVRSVGVDDIVRRFDPFWGIKSSLSWSAAGPSARSTSVLNIAMTSDFYVQFEIMVAC